jgi:hypothetical protein
MHVVVLGSLSQIPSSLTDMGYQTLAAATVTDALKWETLVYPDNGPAYPYMAPIGVGPAVRSSGIGWAIASLIVSSLALVGVIILGVVIAATAATFDLGDTGGTGGMVPLTGQLASAPAGALAGADLADTVQRRITQDGGDVSRMDCPETSHVVQGVVTVCHGSVSGSDYAVIVFFEDAQGRFTLEPV